MKQGAGDSFACPLFGGESWNRFLRNLSAVFKKGNDLNKSVQVAWRYLHTAASACSHERANQIGAERAETGNEIGKSSNFNWIFELKHSANEMLFLPFCKRLLFINLL